MPRCGGREGRPCRDGEGTCLARLPPPPTMGMRVDPGRTSWATTRLDGATSNRDRAKDGGSFPSRFRTRHCHLVVARRSALLVLRRLNPAHRDRRRYGPPRAGRPLPPRDPPNVLGARPFFRLPIIFMPRPRPRSPRAARRPTPARPAHPPPQTRLQSRCKPSAASHCTPTIRDRRALAVPQLGDAACRPQPLSGRSRLTRPSAANPQARTRARRRPSRAEAPTDRACRTGERRHVLHDRSSPSAATTTHSRRRDPPSPTRCESRPGRPRALNPFCPSNRRSASLYMREALRSCSVTRLATATTSLSIT